MPSPEQLEDLYSDYILDHYEAPYHKGRLPDATYRQRARNPLCGDVVELQLKVDENGKVVEAWFEGRGCAISQAAASILCERIEGMDLQQIRQLQAQEMLDLLKVPLTATRQKCGLLPFKVLKTIVYAVDEETGPEKPSEHGSNADAP